MGKPVRRVQCCRVVSRSVRYHFPHQLSLLSIILRALFLVHKQTNKFLIFIVVFFWRVCILFAVTTFSIINISVFRIRRLFVSAPVIFFVVNCLRCSYYPVIMIRVAVNTQIFVFYFSRLPHIILHVEPSVIITLFAVKFVDFYECVCYRASGKHFIFS